MGDIVWVWNKREVFQRGRSVWGGGGVCWLCDAGKKEEEFKTKSLKQFKGLWLYYFKDIPILGISSIAFMII